MIPEHRLLIKQPHFSYVAGASYDFQRHLLKLPKVANKPAVERALIGSLAHIHEMTHWFQHVGTSYGLFRSFLNSSKSDTFLRFLCNEPKSFRNFLLTRRFEQGRALITLDNRSYFTQESSDTDGFGIAKQIWYDHAMLDEYIEDASVVDKIGYAPGESMAHALADVVEYSVDLAKYHSPEYEQVGHKGARSWYDFSYQPIIRVKIDTVGKEEITSKSLQECAAALVEIQYILGGTIRKYLDFDEIKRIVAPSVKSLMNSYYGIPLKAFLRHFKHVNNEPFDFECFSFNPDVIQTLATIIFLALNPPLPPLVIGPRHSSGRPWTWDDLYPPERFRRLLMALPEIGLVPFQANIDELSRYISDISEHASVNIEAIWSNGIRSANSKDIVNASVRSSAENGDISWRLREEVEIAALETIRNIEGSLILLCNPVAMALGHEGRFFEFASPSEEYDFMRPLFVDACTGTEKIGYLARAEIADPVLASVVLDRLTDDFIVGEGDFIDNKFPKDVFHPDPKQWGRNIREIVAQRLML
jgi:hypothetical protein